jgi:hypothetical protein
MKNGATRLSHKEISLLLFALEGAAPASVPDLSSCEEACPIVESVEELLCGGTVDPKQQLIRHLNHHIRDAMMESGVFDMMANGNFESNDLETRSARAMALKRLNRWGTEIKLTGDDRKLLCDALNRLPRLAWMQLPLALWRLRRKVAPA